MPKPPTVTRIVLERGPLDGEQIPLEPGELGNPIFRENGDPALFALYQPTGRTASNGVRGAGERFLTVYEFVVNLEPHELARLMERRDFGRILHRG